VDARDAYVCSRLDEVVYSLMRLPGQYPLAREKNAEEEADDAPGLHPGGEGQSLGRDRQDSSRQRRREDPRT